jgi:hypothetical protein
MLASTLTNLILLQSVKGGQSQSVAMAHGQQAWTLSIQYELSV